MKNAVLDGLAELTVEVTRPEATLTEKYALRYEQFRMIYPACRELFAQLQASHF